MAARLMQIEGRIQKSPEGIAHLMARRVIGRSAELARVVFRPVSRPAMPRDLPSRLRRRP